MQRSFPKKIEKIIGPLPGQREARAFGVAGVAIALVACALSLYFGFRGETFLGRPLGGDFVQFYAAGRILNEYEPARLFDIPLLADMEHASLPTMPRTQMLIFGNAPWIAVLFRPLAKLPYAQAYCVWLVFSAAVYLSGLLILFRNRWPQDQGRAAFLLALSTPMYTLETWIGGQLSVLAFFAFALFVYYFEQQRFWLAGMALGLAAYKPSLIAIPAAMMIAGRCWKTLGGLSLSGVFTLLASIATVGTHGITLWLQTLRVFRYLATDQESVLRRSKYIDLNSFFTILFGVHWIIPTVIIAAAFVILAWTWIKLGSGNPEARRLLWAATIAWTLILNVYVPVYDTIILIPAIALAATVIANHGKEKERSEFQVWLVLLCLIPWLTQSAADFLKVQILTLVLAGFGWWTLRLARGHTQYIGGKRHAAE